MFGSCCAWFADQPRLAQEETDPGMGRAGGNWVRQERRRAEAGQAVAGAASALRQGANFCRNFL